MHPISNGRRLRWRRCAATRRSCCRRRSIMRAIPGLSTEMVERLVGGAAGDAGRRRAHPRDHARRACRRSCFTPARRPRDRGRSAPMGAERLGVSRETQIGDARAIWCAMNAARQNLISRHRRWIISGRAISSIRLSCCRSPAERDGAWLDIGTGAGFPGMVIACLRDRADYLVEPRKRRARFPRRAARHDLASATM